MGLRSFSAKKHASELHAGNPNADTPIWVRDKKEVFGEGSEPSPEALKVLIKTLYKEFKS